MSLQIRQCSVFFVSSLIRDIKEFLIFGNLVESAWEKIS